MKYKIIFFPLVFSTFHRLLAKEKVAKYNHHKAKHKYYSIQFFKFFRLLKNFKNIFSALFWKNSILFAFIQEKFKFILTHFDRERELNSKYEIVREPHTV